ncbi:type II secretion system major pseudopilin GspG [Nitrospirota bacterium]
MKKPHRILSDQSGMTLVELIVVIVILGIMATVVGPRLFGKVDKAAVSQAKHQIGIFKGAINMYRLDTGELPTTQQGLTALVKNPGAEGWDGPYLENTEIPLDPWKNPYVYLMPGTNGRDYDIVSYGKDKAPGGAEYNADIRN